MTDTLLGLLQTGGTLNGTGLLSLVLICVASGFIVLPRAVLCIASGAVFGLWAIAVILPSATLGAALAFLTARHLLGAKFQRRVRHMPRTRAVLDAVDAEGWRIVALLRLGSPVPSMIQNYSFGLSGIGLASFSIATLLSTIPQVALYVYLGAVGRAALFSDASSPLALAGLLMSAAALVAAFVLVTRRARPALKPIKAQHSAGPPAGGSSATNS